jgi:SAM-dependent methyltransferase
MKYLTELANLYWARPENVLWITKVMQELDDVVFDGPILDLMCGHGMWSFVRAGGEFELGFDGFKTLANLDKYQKGEDIQNTFSDEYKPLVKRKPNYHIACGFDWKENNLLKCKALDFYDRLVQGDCNDPLPFEDDEFKTVFSNTIYWVDDLDHILKEVRRIMKADGRAVLINYLPPINGYLDIYKDRTSPEWLSLIDRNRSVENKHIYPKEKWNELFQKAGFNLVDYRPTVNSLYAHIWNIGLRPFAGQILQMANKLSKDEYVEMKRDWVKTIVTLAQPLLENRYFSVVKNGEEVEAIFILEQA